MVDGRPTLVVLTEFKHGEINHPHRCPTGFEQTGFTREFAVANFDAQRTNGVIHYFGRVCAKKDNVAVLRASAAQDSGNGFVVKVFDNGALQAVAALRHVIDFDPGQTFGAINFHELGVTIDVAAAHFIATRHTQSDHTAIGHLCRC